MKKILLILFIATATSFAGTNFIHVPFGGYVPTSTTVFDTNRFGLTAWWVGTSPWRTNNFTNTLTGPTNLTLWPSNSVPSGWFTSNDVENVMLWQAFQAIDTNFAIFDDRVSYLETNGVSSNSFAFNNYITNTSGHSATYVFTFATSTGGAQPVDLRFLVANTAAFGSWDYTLPFGTSSAVTGTFTNSFVVPDLNSNGVLLPSNFNVSATVTPIGVIRIAR